MFRLQDSSGIMLIKTLVDAFRNGDIDLDEMWDVIEKEMQCQKFGNKCVGIPHTCACNQTVHH